MSQQELGQQEQQLSTPRPTWDQMWQLLEQVVAHQQQQCVQDPSGGGAAGAVGGEDAALHVDRYLREADAVALTPPPYPGAFSLVFTRVCLFMRVCV